jgi:hypothetical protein
MVSAISSKERTSQEQFSYLLNNFNRKRTIEIPKLGSVALDKGTVSRAFFAVLVIPS